MKREKLATDDIDKVHHYGNFPYLPSYFCEKDTIFHYTKAKTAVNYILKNNQLKLNKRLKSFDPMENKEPNVFYNIISKLQEHATNQDSYEIKEKLLNNYKNLKQLCFCYNKGKLIRPLKTGSDYVNYEYLGCLKPRMWDQYGDYYNGVCLVFSKKLIEKHSRLTFKKIKYSNFTDILRHNVNIKKHEMEYHGKSKYYELLKDKYYNFYFQKHKDYQQETEIRLYSDSANQNPLFDFKDSLKAIIINAPDKLGKGNYYEQIFEYAQTKNIDLISLDWDFDGFNVDVLNKAK